MNSQMEVSIPSSFGAVTVAAAFLLASILLAAPTVQAQSYSVIHPFTGGADGGLPAPASLVSDAAGNLYGTAQYGGTGACRGADGIPPGCGVVFKLARKNGVWVETPIYTFQGNDGAYPGAQVTIGPDGNLYGTTQVGGDGECNYPLDYSGCGVVFRLAPPSSACNQALCPWTETVLYQFTAGNDGADGIPLGQLTFDEAGNLYGVTFYGEVYELSPSGNGWTETVLYNFNVSGGGRWPASGVIFGQDGNLYGDTLEGGDTNQGVIYQLVHTGSTWTESVIYSFQGLADGAEPEGALILDRLGSGCLIGSTREGPFGGMQGSGTIFTLCPLDGGWNYSLTYTFQPREHEGPLDRLIQDAAGNLYGSWMVSAFELGPNGYQSLKDFDGDDGIDPEGGLVFGPDGGLYGTTLFGGSGQLCNHLGCGVVYEITLQ
jgi:hypothetical protein